MKFPWVSRASRDEARLHAEKWREEALESRRKLCRIAEMETPKANATVKRMARIARGEM